MRVTVELFARLRELAGRDAWSGEVPDGASVAAVWQVVADAHPALGPFGRAVSCAVNNEFAKMTTIVHDGDQIAFLPPVSGGARSFR